MHIETLLHGISGLVVEYIVAINVSLLAGLLVCLLLLLVLVAAAVCACC